MAQTNNYRSLYDGSDPDTGYDLLSEDSNPAHAELRWADGTPSGFSVLGISASSERMSAYVRLPAKKLLKCDEIEVKIRSLESELRLLQAELGTAPPFLKPFLVKEIVRVKNEIAKLKVAECTN